MSIEKLYCLAKNSGDLSPDECQAINRQLASIDATEIPKDQKRNVADYLSVALLMQSVSKDEISSLESLLEELQKEF